MEIFINSFVAGITQTIIGHPFDTVKTIKQIYPNKNYSIILKDIITKNGILYLYRGYFFPLISGCLQNSFIFTLESKFSNHVDSSLISGFLAGGVSTFVMTPAEYVKCKLQIHSDLKYIDVLKSNNIFKGFSLTLLRDSIGFSIYFSSYKYLQSKYDNPFLNGGIAGVLSWVYSYPVDTVKTKYQVNDMFISQIINKTSYSELTAGMRIMLARAFCVNAGIFYTFDYLNKQK